MSKLWMTLSVPPLQRMGTFASNNKERNYFSVVFHSIVHVIETYHAGSGKRALTNG
jgi:hypothetical protein